MALLQVQEEEPVRGLAWVEAFVLQPGLLDLEGACRGGAGSEVGMGEGLGRGLPGTSPHHSYFLRHFQASE